MCVFEMCVRAVSDQLSVVDSLDDSYICVGDSEVCQACVTVRVRAFKCVLCVCLRVYVQVETSDIDIKIF